MRARPEHEPVVHRAPREAPVQRRAESDLEHSGPPGHGRRAAAGSGALPAAADLYSASQDAAASIRAAPVQLKADAGADPSVPAPGGGGARLPEGLRGSMERSFGADFGAVRVHEGPSAASLGGVRAAAQGNDLTFAAGQYDPGAKSGQELIGHELAHVVQQRAGRVQPTGQAKGGMVNTDPGLEAEADRAGVAAAAGKPAGLPQGGGGGGRVAQWNLFTDIRDSIRDKKAQAKKKRDDDKKAKKDRTDHNRTAIDTKRDDPAGAATIAAAAATKLADDLAGWVDVQLKGNKDLGKTLKEHGAATATAHLGTGSQAAIDAGQQTAAIVKAAKADRLAQMSTKARELATPEATAARGDIRTATIAGFDETAGDGPEQEMVDKAVQKATRRAAAAASEKETASKKTLARQLEQQKDAIANDLKTRTEAGVRAKAGEELNARTTADPAVLAAVNPAADEGVQEVEKAAVAYLEDKLGVEGVRATRSAKLKDFHAKMVKAGQDQAKTDAHGAAGGESDELKEDARKRSREGADASTKEALKGLAQEGKTFAIGAAPPRPPLAEAASKAAWGSVREQGRGKHAAKEAVKGALPAVKAAVLAQAKTWKTQLLTDQAKTAEAEQKVKTQVTTDAVGADAAQESLGKKGDVDTAVNAGVPEVEKKVTEDTTKYLEDQIGAMGAHWWKSQEVKDFRAKLKKAGRKEAYKDVDSELAANTTLRPATREYMKVAGKDVAYDKTKGSVNAQMKEFAKEGASDSVTKAAVKAAFEKVGRTTAFRAYRDKKPKRAVAAEVLTAMRGLVGEQTTKAKEKADLWKAELFAGTVVPDAETKVAEKVHTDEVGKRSLKQAINANTTAEGMAAVGRLCDLAVPNRGDSVKLDVEIRIPVPNSPAFVLIRVVAEAERGVTVRKNGAPPGGVDAKSLKVGAQINIGGGADLWGVRLDGSLGFFVRAQAMDTQKTFQALNYGAYRSACQLNNKMADWWGGTGKSKDTSIGGHGKSATERAELWAAMIEENVFMRKNPHYVPGAKGKKGQEYIPDEDAFVDLGGSLTARGKLKAHVFEGEASMRGEVFSRYDGSSIKKAIKKAKQKGKLATTSTVGLGKGGSTEQDALDRRAVIKPKVGGAFIVEAKTVFAILGQKCEFAAKLEVGSHGWGIELGGGLKFDTTGSPTDIEKITSAIVGGAASGLRTLVGMYQNAGQTKVEQGTKGGIGSLLDLGNDAEGVADAATGGKLTTALGEAYKVKAAKTDQVNETVSQKWNDLTGAKNDVAPGNTETRQGAAGETMLAVVFKFGPQLATVEVKQVKVKKVSVGLGTAMLDASLEKSKRLAMMGRIGTKRDPTTGKKSMNFHAEGLGFGTTHEG